MNISPHRIITAIGALALATSLHAQTLKSPWDTYPPKPTQAAYTCPTVPTLPHDIVAADYYSDDKHSIIDPKRYATYNAAKQPFEDVTKAAVEAADHFQKTGSAQAAVCVQQIIAQQAAANAMTGSMSTNQANYVQNWTLGSLAVAALKVRTSAPTSSASQAWMGSVGKQVEDWFQARREKKTKDGQNNHLYWAGFSVMAAGIAANDRPLYNWGVGTYKSGVDLITPEGTLPLEMDRGQKALHYHLFALAPLVTMAEFGTVNGEDLYSYNHNAIHLLVSRSMAGLIDNSFFAQKAGVKQDTPEGGKIKAADVGWVTPYLRRFPDPQIAALLAKPSSLANGYLGGLPPQ